MRGATINANNVYSTSATGQKKAMLVKAQEKKLTQNFMKVPRGGAGLIGGNIEGQPGGGYLAKQQLMLNASEAQTQQQ